MRINRSLSIQDIMAELGCKIDRARQIMLFELPHYDISAPGSYYRAWRCSRKEFERWRDGRTEAAGIEKHYEFERKNMRRIVV